MKIELDYPKLMQISEKRGIYSLAELCRRSGLSYNAVCSSISKRKNVSMETYYRFARVLGCHIEELILPKGKDFTQKH